MMLSPWIKNHKWNNNNNNNINNSNGKHTIFFFFFLFKSFIDLPDLCVFLKLTPQIKVTFKLIPSNNVDGFYYFFSRNSGIYNQFLLSFKIHTFSFLRKR